MCPDSMISDPHFPAFSRIWTEFTLKKGKYGPEKLLIGRFLRR